MTFLSRITLCVLTPIGVTARRSINHDFKSFSTKKKINKHDWNLTLYQFQNCPFCCKLRTYLDYNKLNYNVVEVNSITRKQLKVFGTRKVPLLLCNKEKDDSENKMILRDSSVIISVLESYLKNENTNLNQLNNNYKEVTNKVNGKDVKEFTNRYNLFNSNDEVLDNEEMTSQRRWRDWADNKLVHVISPNIYKTPKESLEAFRYFSKCGDWDTKFSSFEKNSMIYLGSMIMYVIGKRLSKKHNLKQDVSESLDDCIVEFTNELDKLNSKFIGGSKANLADLSIYGILSSMEGCKSFKTMMERNGRMQKWYTDIKSSIY
ncbi:Microsomal prostaglandin E synthase 2 [Intoshia linei]|uniref:Prostaglandin E synthase 2 n=1 Tax=Intoshia linei TaxID=1819745 RepID=A0A177AVI4_9BILA|nr:Microsomal prostaglandin E synthase 2 [Intoshia linei]